MTALTLYFTDLRYEVEADGDGRVVRDRNHMRFWGDDATDVRFARDCANAGR